MRRTLGAAAVITALAVGGTGSASAGIAHEPGAARPAATDAAAKLIGKLQTQDFGPVLVTPGQQALYYWTPEKQSPGKILCTGDCAKAWPPLHVKKGTVVPRKIAGFKGTFGTIRRPSGRLQLTYNRLPLYTYAHEDPRKVLCDNVDGWFVVRL
jgi:predicted lipoprotein with Yx(FWY)xxD motif